MKKIISMALLAAMLLSCFAGCAMQKGEIDVENYVEEAVAQDTAVTIPENWKDGLTAWDGSVDTTWYDSTKTTLEIADGADLRAFLVEVRTNNNTFSGKTVKVTNNINLGGKEWAPIVCDTSNNAGVFFAGTFDGNNKIIGNFTMNINDTTTTEDTADVYSGYSLLGGIGGAAEVKDLSVVEGTYILGCTVKSSVAGGIVAEVNTTSGSTAKLTNLYSNCVIKMADPVSGKTYYSYSVVGGVVAKIKGGGNISVTNCTFDGSITINGGNAAGVIGNINSGVLNVTVDGCRNNGAITGTAQLGGIIGNSEAKTTLTINNCKNAGAITCGNNSGGILGRQKNVALTALTITNCDNLATGTITTNGGYCAGIVGQVSDAGGDTTKTNSLVVLIEDCNNYAAVAADNNASGGGRLAGIIGTFVGKADSAKTYTIKLTIKDCNNSGAITAVVAFDEGETVAYDKNTHCGGIAGYIYGGDNKTNLLAETIVENCHSTGDVYANRSTGGLIGYIQRSHVVTIKDCSVDADVTVNMVSNGNQHAGGLIARVDLEGGKLSGDAINACKLTIDNCTVAGKFTMIETYSKNDATKSGNIYGAGLIGTFRRGTVEIKNCTVKAALVEDGFSNSSDTLNYFLGMKDSAGIVTAKVGNKYYKLGNSVGSFDLGPDVSATLANNIVGEGVQYRINADNTADIRYVFGIVGFNEGFDNAIGFDVDIKTIVNDVVVPRETATGYATYVYKTLNGTDANGNPVVYTAGEGEYKDIAYFTVVTLKGIPENMYVVEDNNIHVKNSVVEVTPFFQNVKDSGKAIFSKVTMLSNVEYMFDNANVTATLPSKFEGAQAIITTIDPLDGVTNFIDNAIDKNVVEKISCGNSECEACVTGGALGNREQFAWKNTCTCTDCTLAWSANAANTYIPDATVEGMLPHFYIDATSYKSEFGVAVEDLYDCYYSFTFTVAEAGVYDFCFQIRNKGDDGATNQRYALIQINDQEFDQQTKLCHNITISNVSETNPDGNTNSTLQESFITGFSAELVAGENTITIRAPYIGGGNGYMHIRDILIVKAN